MAELVRRNWPIMGSHASLMLVGVAAEADAAARVAHQVLDGVDKRFSSYRPDSELSRFAAGRIADPSVDLRHALAACEWLAEVSQGVFTTSTSHDFDLAGYVKGWAVDQAADALIDSGFACFAVGVGGDWRAVGQGPGGRRWRFGVLDPKEPWKPRALATLADSAIATSGLYERGEHLHRVADSAAAAGRVPQADACARPDTASFTVAGPRLAWADAFATVGFLLGDDGLGWVAQFEGYSAAVVRADGSMLADDVFPLTEGTVAQFPALAAPYDSTPPHTASAPVWPAA